MHREARIPRLYTELFHRHTANPLLTLAYDRAQESEAEHIGPFLMTFAGYGSDQAVAFRKEMQAVAERGPQSPGDPVRSSQRCPADSSVGRLGADVQGGKEGV